jgi:GNAT superfamily N-acetyltransferase
MIDWVATQERFGVNKDTIKTRDKVMVACDKCNQMGERLYGTIKKTLVKKGVYCCFDCAVKSSDFKKECSERATKLWQDESYKANNLTAVQSLEYKEKKRQESTDRWASAEYRMFMMSEEMCAIRKFNSRQAALKLWQNSEYREKLLKTLSERMTAKWREEEYRRFMVENQRIKTLKLWQQGTFANAFTAQFKAKMQIVNSAPKSKETLLKLSDSAKKVWENSDYRKRVITGNKKMWANDDYKARMAIHRANQPRESSIQKLLYKFLDDLNVRYEKEGSNTVIGYFAFDCMVHNQPKNLLIECQGDYWHALENAKRNDKAKFTYIDRYFPEYEVMYVWEHEFYTKDRVLDRLKLKLGIDVEIVDFKFDDICVRQVSSKDVRQFLDAYHYVGKGRGGKCVGAYHGDELVACVVYSPPLRQNMADMFGEFVELSRFCIHPAYHKKNFATWLIARANRFVDANIVSYCDTTVGHIGTIYKAANFKLHHEVNPDYWYVDGSGFVMHKKTLYSRAVRMKLSEGEFAAKFNYVKKYGGMKHCYVLAKREVKK